MTATPTAAAPAMLDHALRLARAGLRVFPLKPTTGLPQINRWPELATTDESQLRRWWSRWPTANVGVETTGLLVLDVDVKNGKQGAESYDTLRLLYGDLPETYRQRTPTGGQHIVMRAPPGADARCSAERLAPGLDVRGHHGFIVGAGSAKPAGAYIAESDPARIAEAPQWLADLCRPATPPAGKQRKPVAPLDTDEAIGRTREFLEHFAEPSIEGAGGDDQAYRVAARVKDLGVSPDMALDLMLEHWNDRCAPPWDPDDLAQKIANAYRYGENAPASATAAGDFDEANGAPPLPPRPAAAADPFDVKLAERPKLYFILARDVAPRFDQRNLVRDLLDHAAMSVVYGASNSGKTFYCFSLGWHVAIGREFLGRPVEQTGVVYVAAEAGRSGERRLEALRRETGVHDAPFALVPCPVDLLRPTGDTKALIDLIRQAESAMGRKVGLVIIDTLSRALAGGNENAPDDMGQLVKHFDAIRLATGAHLMVVHHSGKSAASGARGHSLLRAATDTEIEIADRVIRATKQRDMDYGPPQRFDLKPVVVGAGPDGREVTSCVVIDGGPVDMALELTGREDDMLRAAVLAVRQTGAPTFSWKAWLAAAKDVFAQETKRYGAAVLEDGLADLRDTLEQKGRVEHLNRKSWRIINSAPINPSAE